MPIDMLVVGLAALVTSGLTLFSGFGLGTLLMPVMSLFFPLPEAIAMTALVHLLNNFFKLILLGKHSDLNVALRFGVPAMLAAFVGAWLLHWLSASSALLDYQVLSYKGETEVLKLVVGILILVLVLWELAPAAKTWTVPKKFLPIGGLLSGFLGGLSGHQGAFRSTFLLQCGLSKQAFLGTGVVIACLIDGVRLVVYRSHLQVDLLSSHGPMLLTAILAAFCGAFLAQRWSKNVKLSTIRHIMTLLLIVIGLGLILGFI